MTAEGLRRKLQHCLGGPWPEACPLDPRHHGTTRKDGYSVESVSYEVEPGDRVPAWLLVPDGVDADHPAPAIAVGHMLTETMWQRVREWFAKHLK